MKTGNHKFLNPFLVSEASITVKSFDFGEYKNTGGPKAVKKMKLKIKVSQGKGFMGSDLAIFTGQEKDLVAYAQKYLGADGKSLKDVQKELN